MFFHESLVLTFRGFWEPLLTRRIWLPTLGLWCVVFDLHLFRFLFWLLSSGSGLFSFRLYDLDSPWAFGVQLSAFESKLLAWGVFALAVSFGFGLGVVGLGLLRVV